MNTVAMYTKRQKEILDGSIPLENVGDASLKRILDKAVASNDLDVAKKVGHWLSVREEQRDPEFSRYTEKQQAVLSGRIPAEEVSGHLACALLRRATELEDEKVIVLARELARLSHERYLESNRQRAKKRKRDIRNDVYEWKQPKASEYSEHHRKVISGEIPLDKVATKELVSIHLIAKKAGDIDLSERFLSLIIVRVG